MIKSTKKGFTLIELLVVIAIIGILSSVVIASMNSARMKSRDARRISDIGQIKTALELYFDSNQEYPAALTGLTANFIPRVPTDPQSQASYTYTASTTAAGAVTAYCLGATLEDSGNVALTNDADVGGDSTGAGACDAAAFSGGSSDCLGAAGADQCFDVTP